MPYSVLILSKTRIFNSVFNIKKINKIHTFITYTKHNITYLKIKRRLCLKIPTKYKILTISLVQ